MSVQQNYSDSEPLTKIERFTIATLCLVNLINYMDRFSVAAVLIQIQAEFLIGDDLAGLLQTGFIFSYMIFSPLFGYFGDRYSRRLLLIICIALWSLMTTIGSCAPNYWMFFLTRIFLGVGEAGYTTIAPAVISDIVSKDARSIALACFYIAIPFGAGLGYLVSAKLAQYMGGWRWGMRFTPIFSVIGILMLCFSADPKWGEKEAAAIGGQPTAVTPYQQDLKSLVKNPSFMLTMGACTCICFITGTLGWWAPKCLYYGFKLISATTHVELSDVVFNFGAITATTGLLGVVTGSLLSKYLRHYWPAVDPAICGLGMLISLPFLVSAFFVCVVDKVVTFVCLFFGQLLLNLNWAVQSDIMLYVVIPTRRSTAGAIQMFISHVLGDCFSPYIVGLMSEYFKKNWDMSDYHIHFFNYSPNKGIPDETDHQIFYSLQRSLLTTMVLQLLGAVLFLVNVRCVVEDRQKADDEMLAAT